jgi:hypothetical protein
MMVRPKMTPGEPYGYVSNISFSTQSYIQEHHYGKSSSGIDFGVPDASAIGYSSKAHPIFFMF